MHTILVLLDPILSAILARERKRASDWLSSVWVLFSEFRLLSNLISRIFSNYLKKSISVSAAPIFFLSNRFFLRGYPNPSLERELLRPIHIKRSRINICFSDVPIRKLICGICYFSPKNVEISNNFLLHFVFLVLLVI